MSQSAPPPQRIFSNSGQVVPKQTFPVMDLVGGLYRRKNPILIRPNQWFTHQNWVPYEGGIRKIGGFKLHGQELAGNLMVKGLYEFVYYNGGFEFRKLLINAGGKLYTRPLPQLFTTVFFNDPFTRADQTTAPPGLGQNWVDPYMTTNGRNLFGIDTNRAEVKGSALIDNGRASAWYYKEIPSADYDAQVDVQFMVDSAPTVNRWAALLTKVKDENNNYRLEASASGLSLYRRLAGVDTLLGKSAIDSSLLFGDGFESYTAAAAPTSPWVASGVGQPPRVQITTAGPDGSLATLQIEGVGYDGKVARDISSKWASVSGSPIKITFYVKQTAQAAVTTNIFGVLEDSTLTGANDIQLLRLNSAHQFEFQYWTGAADAWLNSGRLCEIGKWYKLEFELFARYYSWKINGTGGTGPYPGPTDEHNLDHIWFPGNDQAASTTFIDLVRCEGADFEGTAVDTVLLTENFDSYTAGNGLDHYNPPYSDLSVWQTQTLSWGSQSIIVKNTVAQSGANSIRVYGPVDGGTYLNYAGRDTFYWLGTNNYFDVQFYLRADGVADNTDAAKYTIVHQWWIPDVELGSPISANFEIGTTRVDTEPIHCWFKTGDTGSVWTALGDLTVDTWIPVKLRFYHEYVEVYFNGALVDTQTFSSPTYHCTGLSHVQFKKIQPITQSIYVDSYTVSVNGAPAGISGLSEATTATIKTSHRGDRITCSLNGEEVFSVSDPGSPLNQNKYAGIQGYIDSLFDNFYIYTPAADTLIGDIPDGFYDYATILNNAIICVNDGRFGIAKPYRFDGTNLYSLELAAPTAAPTAGAPAAGGAITDGAHYYAYTYIDALGNESNPSAVSATQTCGSGNNTINLSGILASPNSAVVSRRIYRTSADGGTLMWLADIADNTTTTYADVLPDASLSTTVAPDDNDPAPTAGFCVAHQNRLYLTGDPDEPDIVYPSYVGEICAFPAALQLPFNRNMGDRNTGLHVYGEKVHIFKTEKTACITDTDPDYWAISIISNIHGSVSERSNAIVGNALVFKSKSQISALVGNRIINLSREIDGLLDEMEPDEPFYAHAVNNLSRHRYELHYREKGQEWPNKAIFMHYDESLSSEEDASRVWSGPHTLPFSCSATLELEKSEYRVVAGSVKADGRVFLTDEGLNFDGVASVSICTGPQAYFQQPDLEKRLRGMFFYWKATKVIYVQVDRDFEFLPKQVFPTLQPVFSPKNKLHLRGTCRFAQVSFYHDTLDEDVEIYGYSWEYQALTLRR